MQRCYYRWFLLSGIFLYTQILSMPGCGSDTVVTTNNGELPLSAMAADTPVIGRDADFNLAVNTVKHVWRTISEQPVQLWIGDERVLLDAQQLLYCTNRRCWVAAADVCSGDTVLTINNSEVAIDACEYLTCRMEVVGITIDPHHTYCVTRLGILVHNEDFSSLTESSTIKVTSGAVQLVPSVLTELAAVPACGLLTLSCSWELPAIVAVVAPYVAVGAAVGIGCGYGVAQLIKSIYARQERNSQVQQAAPRQNSSSCAGNCANTPSQPPEDPNSKKNKKKNRKDRRDGKKDKQKKEKECSCERLGSNLTDTVGCTILYQGEQAYAKYIANPKHGMVARWVGGKRVSPEPINGLEALKNSVEFCSGSGARYGISCGQLVVLRVTSEAPELIFHGYVPEKITQEVIDFISKTDLAGLLKSILK